MTQFLISLLPASLWIYFVNILFQEGHLFEGLGNWMENNLPDKLNKPTWMCPICMASFWGAFWIALGLPVFFHIYHSWELWMPYIFCLAGLNTIINKLISKERIIVDE